MGNLTLEKWENSPNYLKAIFALLWFISGCSSSAPIVITPTTPTTPVIEDILPSSSEMISERETVTQQPIQMPTLKTATVIPTEILDPLAIYPVTEKCLTLLDDFPDDSVPQGRIVIGYLGTDKSTYIYDFQTGEMIDLGVITMGKVSPNDRTFAYKDRLENQIVISDTDGNPIRIIPDADEVLWLGNWVNDQYIIFDKQKGIHEPGTRPEMDSLILLNVFNGEQIEIPSGQYPVMPGTQWSSFTPLRFSPGLNYLVYPKLEDNWPLVIFDMQTEQIIKRVFHISPWTDPVWAPDSSKVILSAMVSYDSEVNVQDDLPCQGYELFSLTIDGNIKRLTCLTSEDVSLDESWMIWSPDQSKIAFTLNSWSTGERNPAVLDLETGVVTVICSQGFATDWSSDSKYLVITGPKVFSPLLVVDSEAGYAVQIADNASSGGWLHESPP